MYFCTKQYFDIENEKKQQFLKISKVLFLTYAVLA